MFRYSYAINTPHASPSYPRSRGRNIIIGSLRSTRTKTFTWWGKQFPLTAKTQIIESRMRCAFSVYGPSSKDSLGYRKKGFSYRDTGSSLADSVLVKYSCIFLAYSKPRGVDILVQPFCSIILIHNLQKGYFSINCAGPERFGDVNCCFRRFPYT